MLDAQDIGTLVFIGYNGFRRAKVDNFYKKHTTVDVLVQIEQNKATQVKIYASEAIYRNVVVGNCSGNSLLRINRIALSIPKHTFITT